MKRAWLWAALGAASWAGCGDPTLTSVTQLNLDRPVDISFACFGPMRQIDGDPRPGVASDPILPPTAQPLAACEALSPALTPLDGSTVHPPQPVLGQETLTDSKGNPISGPIVPDWYAFILQSASGTVALAKWPVKAADTIASGISDSGGDFSVLDGDPLTPGKNAISIGEDPVAIATDRAGCFEVTANAGSCDLSELDINSALDDISPVKGKPPTPIRVDRVQVTNTKGDVILARPAAMVAEPGSTVVGIACPKTATGRVFIAYPGCHLVAGVDTATGKIISAIKYDTPGAPGVPTILSGTDLDSVSCPRECIDGSGATSSGPITAGPQPVALDLRLDTDDRKSAVTSRLAIGAKNSASLTIVELDLANSDPNTSDLKSLSQVALEDTTGKLGITAVALSPQIGMGGKADFTTGAPVNDTGADAPGGQGQYIYAVANDGTVRVADVLSLHRECDTQIDGRFLRSASITELQCLPPRDPARPRRSGARGPGIELPGNAVPTSVAIIKPRSGAVPELDDNGKVKGFDAVTATTLVGSFAVITATTGATYVVNIDDDGAPDAFDPKQPLGTAPVLAMAHQLRDSFTNREQGLEGTKVVPDPDHPGQTKQDSVRTCQVAVTADPPATKGGTSAGGPRTSGLPTQSPLAGTITVNSVLPLPAIQQVECTGGMADADLDSNMKPIVTAASTLQLNAPESTRDLVFPDLRSVNNETWTLTWEGTLSLDNITIAVDGPVVRSGQITVDGFGMKLVDPAQPFCEMGAEPFDIVELRGCSPANNNGDCPAGYTCYVHPKSQGTGVGACMRKDEAPRLADACRDFLTTRRHYTVGTTSTGDLTLLERRHDLASTPIDGCVDDDQCKQLALDASKIDPSTDPFDSQKSQWVCEADALRAPVNADPARNKRCVQHCTLPMPGPDDPDPMNHQANCPSGTVCKLLNPLKQGDTRPYDPAGICMEGVEPPQACVRGPQHYDVRASEAFTVVGSRSGYVHPIIKDPKSAACIRDPNVKDANNVQSGRIPMSVPACGAPDTTDPVMGELLDPVTKAHTGVFEANPCKLTAPQFDTIQPLGMPACTAARQVMSVPAMRDAQAIKFRNRAMTLTLVDPYQSCVPNQGGDPAGNPSPGTKLATIQLANRGYQIQFQQTGGFSPLQVLLGQPATYPVKIVRGPSSSLWVIDDGDLQSTGLGTTSTRGRVFRIEGVDINVSNLLQ